MDKGETPITVDDLLRLVDGLKSKGVNQFRWGDIEFTSGAVRSQPKPEPKNAVDLALDLNGRSTDEENESD